MLMRQIPISPAVYVCGSIFLIELITVYLQSSC